MRIAFTDVDGCRVRYFHEGDGDRVIVLLHGLGISADTWARNIDVLAKNFRVIAPDLPGHGFTELPDLKGRAAHPTMVEVVLGLLDQLGIEKFSICGHSYGATIAALIYFERPESIEKLIFNGSHRIFQSCDETVKGFEKSYANAKSAIGNPSLDTCRQRMGNVCHDPANIPEEVLLIQLTSYAQPTMAADYEKIARANMDLELSRPYRCGDRIHEVSIPVLVISGKEDVRVPVADLEAGMKRLQDGKLVLVEKCGHMLQTEHASLFNKNILQFLGG